MGNDSNLFGVGSGFSGSTTPSLGGSLTGDFLGQTTGLDSIFSGNNDFRGGNNFGFGQNLGIGSNSGQGSGFSPISLPGQGLGAEAIGNGFNSFSFNNQGQQGGFLGGLKNFSDNYLNKDFLMGSKNNLGLIPTLSGAAQTIGGLRNSNRQFNFGKKQYADQLAVFNNNQQNLKEDSIRTSTGILDNSSFAKDFTEEERQAYIDQRTYKPKTI